MTIKHRVFLTDHAAADLEELYAFISDSDSRAAADHVLGGIEKAFKNPEAFPNRGSHPKELLSLGIKEYREIFFKPYRIIYRVEKSVVLVHLITDGRRDMQTLLARRLLRG